MLKSRRWRKDDSIFFNVLNSIFYYVLSFLQSPFYTASDISDRRSGDSGSAHRHGTSCACDFIAVTSGASGLNDPRRNGRHAEISDDSDNHKNAIDRIASVGYERRVLQSFDVLLEH